MTYTRKIVLEYEREYDTIQEAKDDEDSFLRDTICEDVELYSNELTDESGSIVEGKMCE